MMGKWQQQQCFHCGTSLNVSRSIRMQVAGQYQQVCCAGCQSVVEALDANLFYQAVKETETMKLTEITPIEMRCGTCDCGCPAVFATDNNSYVIIGKKLDATTSAQLHGRIADDEFVIEISKDMLEQALR